MTAPVGARLWAGSDNVLQKAVVEQFVPRFAPGARLLFLRDGAQNVRALDSDRLAGIGVAMAEPDRLPDVVLHQEANDWLFLVDAVTSCGPVSRERLIELEALLTQCAAGRIYVTAVPDLTALGTHREDVAWGTAVWLSDEPDHLIHYDGDQYLAPRFGA